MERGNFAFGLAVLFGFFFFLGTFFYITPFSRGGSCSISPKTLSTYYTSHNIFVETTKQLDMSDYFHYDYACEPITYTAIPNYRSGFGIKVQDEQLFITGKEQGSSTVIVGATNGEIISYKKLLVEVSYPEDVTQKSHGVDQEEI